MQIATHKFKTFARAGAIALFVSTGALAANPAQAETFLSFSMQSPGGTSITIGNGGFNGRHFMPNQMQPRPVPKVMACITEREMRRTLKHQGFYDVRLVDRDFHEIEAIAEYRGDRVHIVVNACNGRVTEVSLLHRNFSNDWWR